MHIPRIAITLLVVPLLLSCGGADEAEIARAKTFMEQVCQYPAGDHRAFRGMALVKSPNPFQAVPRGIMVSIAPRGVRFKLADVGTAAELAEANKRFFPLADKVSEEYQLQTFRAKRNPNWPAEPLVLAFDASTPAKSVQVVLATVNTAYSEVLLALEAGNAPPPPTPPDRVLADELRSVPEDKLTSNGFSKLVELADDCTPLAHLAGPAAYYSPDEFCEMFTDKIGEVFGPWSCRADLDEAVTAMHAMMIPHRPVTVHPIELRRDAPIVSVKPTDTWAQIAPKLIEHGDKPFWLELAEEAPAAAPPTPQ